MGNSAKVTQDSKIAFQIFLILISGDISVKCIKLYAILKSRPKLNFGCYLTFEFTFEVVDLDNFAFYSSFDR